MISEICLKISQGCWRIGFIFKKEKSGSDHGRSRTRLQGICHPLPYLFVSLKFATIIKLLKIIPTL